MAGRAALQSNRLGRSPIFVLLDPIPLTGKDYKVIEGVQRSPAIFTLFLNYIILSPTRKPVEKVASQSVK